MAANKGFDDQSFREVLREREVRPLVKHREFTLLDQAHNALSVTTLQPALEAETAYSTVKCSLGSAMRART